MQLLGQQLGFPGGLCHFLFAVAVGLLGSHVAELQVVDNNCVTLIAALQ